MLSAVSQTVVRRPSGATAGLITVEFNYELSYITTESLISIHPLAPLTRWYHAVCAQSAYRVHTAIVLSENERSRATPTTSLPLGTSLTKVLPGRKFFPLRNKIMNIADTELDVPRSRGGVEV